MENNGKFHVVFTCPTKGEIFARSKWETDGAAQKEVADLMGHKILPVRVPCPLCGKTHWFRMAKTPPEVRDTRPPEEQHQIFV